MAEKEEELVQPELVKMRRPRKVEEKAVFPAGFPGRAELAEIGITTFDQLSALRVLSETYGDAIAEALEDAQADYVEADVDVREVEGYLKAGWEKGEAPASAKKSSPALSGRLPDDFPGFAALQEAGIHTYGQVRKARADGVKIPGIGDGIGAQIDEALVAAE